MSHCLCNNPACGTELLTRLDDECASCGAPSWAYTGTDGRCTFCGAWTPLTLPAFPGVGVVATWKDLYEHDPGDEQGGGL